MAVGGHGCAVVPLNQRRVPDGRDGRSRQFAFIGYRSEDDAARATKYYNRTFFDTTRIR